ncbi:cytochrome P450 3A29-like [Penaeus japonicus]|uniref:cytochrome P450 3A29-like n=1 Tax=Penaeus japonicus TaxID=27405 RepID=UPI001C712764|nr:cytochrome P450 3A29-like [Penaeus japonicus]XP_042878443.1 cytochrome P450 3A29-like [Penaeus japonicus]
MQGPIAALAWLWTNLSVFTLTLLLSSIVLYLYQWVKERRQYHSIFAKMGVPYVKPHLLYGSNHQIRGKGILPTDVISKWVKTYGKVFGYYVGWKPMIVVSDLDMVKDILIKEFHNFANRPKLVIEAQPVVHTVVGLRDQRWKDVRSILAPTFSMVKMKHMAGIMNEKVNELLTIIDNKSKAGVPIEWYSTYQGLTLDVISECALAMKTTCQRDQEKDEFFTAVRSFLKNAVNPAIILALYFRGFGKILSFISNRFALSGRMTQMIVRHVKTVIDIRRKDLHVKNVDVLQLMLEAAESRVDTDGSTLNGLPKEKPKHKLLSDEEIIANAWVFLLGGFETTANSLTYTTYLLTQNQHIQDKLYQELQDKIKTDGQLTYEQVNSLTYLDQVFSEALRLHPPVVTFITREAAEDMQIGDVHIPKDMNVLIPIWLLQRDPEQWPDPLKFDPDRFSPEAKANNTRHPMAYIPFGAGPRNCVGMRFAQLEAKLTLARVLLNYRLVPCEETPNPLKFEIPTVAINPADPVLIKAIPRE